MACPAGADPYVRAERRVHHHAACRRPGCVTVGGHPGLRAGHVVAAQRQFFLSAVCLRRPGFPGRPAARHAAPVQQWHAKIRMQGLLGSYRPCAYPAWTTSPTKIPGRPGRQDCGRSHRGAPGHQHPAPPAAVASDWLILAARFEDYLNWRHTGPPTPRSAKETADRIGWHAHTVAKRCENIRDRYSRLGVPGCAGRGRWTNWRCC